MDKAPEAPVVGGEGWRTDIEAAPHGKKVIVRAKGDFRGERTMMARFYPKHTLEAPEGYGASDGFDEDEHGDVYAPAGWYEDMEAEEPPLHSIEPTHWMPVPDKPGASPSPSLSALDAAPIAEIAAERRRQIEAEGWTPEHDDEHDRGEMAKAAACYAYVAGLSDITRTCDAMKSPATREGSEVVVIRRSWPWDWKWWKPSVNRRRDLIKAGALIVAEIERLDRAAAIRALHAGGKDGN